MKGRVVLARNTLIPLEVFVSADASVFGQDLLDDLVTRPDGSNDAFKGSLKESAIENNEDRVEVLDDVSTEDEGASEPNDAAVDVGDSDDAHEVRSDQFWVNNAFSDDLVIGLVAFEALRPTLWSTIRLNDCWADCSW